MPVQLPQRAPTNSRHIQHFATDLDARIAAHRAGTGARLVEVVTAAGIGFVVARTWPGTRRRERQLKRQGGASRICPLCKAQQRRAPRSA